MGTSANSGLLDSATKADTVYASEGAVFFFSSQTMAVWAGMRPLDATAFGGPVFLPTGGLGSIGQMEIGAAPVSQSLTFSLSGLDPVFSKMAINQASEVKGRDCQVWLFRFDQSENLIWAGIICTRIMDIITRGVSNRSDPPTAIFSLSAEPILADRNKAPNDFLSDADQRARYPGDRGLERTQELTGKRTMQWG